MLAELRRLVRLGHQPDAALGPPGHRRDRPARLQRRRRRRPGRRGQQHQRQEGGTLPFVSPGRLLDRHGSGTSDTSTYQTVGRPTPIRSAWWPATSRARATASRSPCPSHGDGGTASSTSSRSRLRRRLGHGHAARRRRLLTTRTSTPGRATSSRPTSTARASRASRWSTRHRPDRASCWPTPPATSSCRRDHTLSSTGYPIGMLAAAPFMGTRPAGYSGPTSDPSTLVQNTGGTWTRTYPDGTVIQFNSSGQETSETDATAIPSPTPTSPAARPPGPWRRSPTRWAW